VTAAAVVGFLRRELAPTPGRGHATFRLTVACLIATIPILTHRIPFGLVVMILMYLITQEDTSTTLLGSVLGVVGVTVSLGVALLAWMVALDLPELRIGITAAFLFGGLFLKRVLSIGALGSALGLPAALVMILPDAMSVPGVSSPSPELLTELLLWLWLSVTLGLAVNLGVQFLLAPGDPLTLLERELDARLRAVAETVQHLAGSPVPPTASLDALATSGMSRPLALLKNASLTRSWARQRHEQLAAIITLVDRLVTDAAALRTLASSSPPDEMTRVALLRVGDACAQVRAAFAERRRPAPGARSARPDSAVTTWPPLTDMERTLDQIALAVPTPGPAAARAEPKPGLLLPDAFTNPEYVQFAAKGMTACLISYLLFVGFDYPGIYTSVITCFVISLSTIGSSNQKGLLRFGGAAVGGLMGVLALVYAFPNVQGLGGFWLVFAAGTAVAAWINFGSPRIAYGGYQIGVAFYKATLQGFGPAVSATVVRDRLIGVALGLIVFGLLERVWWPVRAADRMHARLADVFRSLAALARVASRPRDHEGGLAARRNAISQQVTDVQGFIESSKFEPGAGALDAQIVQRLTADAQAVFLVLLAIAHDAEAAADRPVAVSAATSRVDEDVAEILDGLADRARPADAMPAIDLDGSVAALAQSIDADADADTTRAGLLALYRQLAAAVNRLGTSAMSSIPPAMPSPVAR
jgi:multidrug resistance protein MdtO